MGNGEVVNVDEVADAGAIGSGIVGAENADGRYGAEGGAENVGEEMRFGLVALTVAIPGAGGVEVP